MTVPAATLILRFPVGEPHLNSPIASNARPALGWGRQVRDLWALEPELRYLNHGAFGATPHEILAEQASWQHRVERNPARFFMHDLPGLLREAAARLAAFVGTAPARLAFVENATSGANAVIRSLRLRPGDELATTDHVYNAVRNALRHSAAQSGAHLVEIPLGSLRDPEQVAKTVMAGLSERTRLLVIDHVASASAAVLPVATIAAACRARGIPVLVDGAHAPGMLDLDVDAIGADWYVGNCHKWLCAPKGAGFIAVSEQSAIEVHPLAISHAYGQGFAAEFDKTGTRDVSPWLSVPAAIRFHERLGAAALRRRNKELADAMAASLAAELGALVLAPPDMLGSMASLRLPGNPAATWEAAAWLQDALYRDHNIEAAITTVTGALCVRISAQAYNDEQDYCDLGPALLRALASLPAA